MSYTPRVIDQTLDELLPQLAAIALDGPKGVGKTTTAERRCRSAFRLDDLARREAVAAEPRLILRGPHPTLIDEWQLVPATWDVVRRQVDRDPAAAQFVLTGSATLRPGDMAHFRPGRVARLRMRPMAMSERGISETTVSLGELLGGGRPALEGESEIDLIGYADEIVRSGFPGIRGLGQRARQHRLTGYLRGIVDRDVPDQGFAVRKPDVMLAWLAAYAAASSTTTSYSKILDAAVPDGSGKPAKTTIIAYRDVLSQLWLPDPLQGWSPSDDVLHRFQQAPKHHLADPALAARLIGATAESLIGGQATPVGHGAASLIGRLFESLATLSVRVCAQGSDATVSYVRTGNGTREVDLVAARPDGGLVAAQVTLSGSVEDDDVRQLLWLRDRLGPRLLDAIVITTGPIAYRRRDGLGVVPLALLGP